MIGLAHLGANCFQRFQVIELDRAIGDGFCGTQIKAADGAPDRGDIAIENARHVGAGVEASGCHCEVFEM